jgi:OPA family glycerol-3-phosphate transporter-like MFS transporter
MNPTAATVSPHPQYPPGFRARRGLNWGFIGLLYTSYYMCRYNFSIANKSISEEFGFSRADMGTIITTALLAYACGQIINGLLTDRLGGKRAMLVGATGTIIMNILFGAASMWGTFQPVAAGQNPWVVKLVFLHADLFIPLLTMFVVIRGIDGYLQAFGAPGMVKINAAWFGQTERGRFAGIFGFMINLGRFGIFKIGPMLLAGFTFWGMWQVSPLHWRWLFWVPSCICAVIAIGMALTVKETPEEAGFHGAHAGEADHADTGTRAQLGIVLKTIATNPMVWVVALAYACTGAVRQGVDQWFPRFLQEVHHFNYTHKEFAIFGMTIHSNPFTVIGFLIPFVASAGSLASGYISDTVFKGRRTPVAAGLYFLETAIILLAAQFHSAGAAMVFLVLISLTANSTHSILGTAAAMDIGGRKMAGFASGVIDSFQYFGGSLAGYFLGHLLDKSWGYYFYFMAPFGFIGGILMLTIRGKITAKAKTEPLPVATDSTDGRQ